MHHRKTAVPRDIFLTLALLALHRAGKMHLFEKDGYYLSLFHVIEKVCNVVGNSLGIIIVDQVPPWDPWSYPSMWNELLVEMATITNDKVTRLQDGHQGRL